MPDGSDHLSRWIRSGAYLLMSAGGVLALISPLFRAEYPVYGQVMAGFFTVGGGLSFVGSVTRRWVGEYVGLPPLAVAFTVFATLAAAQAGVAGWRSAPWVLAANLCLLYGLALALLARWREVQRTYRLSVAVSRKEGVDET